LGRPDLLRRPSGLMLYLPDHEYRELFLSGPGLAAGEAT
jgi:hypothetical protein